MTDELLELFALDAPGRVERIRRELDAHELENAASEAHRLRGAAATVGLEQLGELAEQLELTLRNGGERTRADELVAAIDAEVSQLDLRQPTVLQVEDDPVNARLIERALARRPGVRLVTAATVEDGARLAHSERPTLVLVDLHLPDASGAELVRRLPENVAVVLVTADGQPPAALEVADVLTKPVDVGRLLELVDEHAPSDGHSRSAADSFRDREIVEAVPQGIVLLDTEGIVLDVNAATETLLGYRRGEIVGESCIPFTHPDDHRIEEPLLDAVLRGESDGYTLEKRYVRKDGDHVWTRLDLRSIRDDDGAPRRVLALLEDISERRRIDEQVRTILECITDGFVALDRDWRYTYVNERAGELLGRPAAELVGKNIWEEFPEGVGQPFYDAYTKAMNEQTTVSFEEHYEPWDRWFENRVYGSGTGIAIYFTEVTERKRIEEIERRQRERAEALRDVNDALTRTLDLDEVLRVLLESLRGFVPYSSASVLLAKDALGHDALVRRVFEEGRALTRDDERWLGVPLLAGGEVIGVCTIGSDEALGSEDVGWAEAIAAHAAAAIEKARLHDELRRHAGELERRIGELDEAQRVAHVGSFEWDILANRVSWSDELYRIYGVEPAAFEATFEAFIGRIHPDDRDTVTATITRAVQEVAPFRMSERIIRPTAELRYLESWGEVAADEDGRPIRLLGICHDVTEQRRQRERAEALRDVNDALTRTLDLEEVFGLLLDSIARFVSYGRGTVLLLTDESALVIGALRGFDGMSDDEVARRLVDASERPAVQRILGEGSTVVAGDDEVVAEDARREGREHTWVGVPLRAGGQVIGLCAVQSVEGASFAQEDVDWIEALTQQAAAAIENARLHDRVQRHAAELEQRVDERTRDLSEAKDEAERANRAKSDFLAGISHELRTPMNAILGFAQLLELDELGGEQGDNVRQILRAGRHLLELITELLDIARIEAGELGLSLEPVSVAELIVEAAELTRPVADRHSIEISTGAAPREEFALADRQRLRQVLLNLLANAVKYNRPGGKVEVACADAAEERIAIAVRDTGRGIAPEDLDRLFEPFERLGVDSASIEGAGLGLALAKRLVHAMNGTLTVASELGSGSTFTIDLPRAADPLAALDAAPVEPGVDATHTAATIVYVEDNLANLRLVERALAREAGLRLLTATEGARGLELVREARPDLVLLDLHLPDVSGEELLDALQSEPGTAAIPVVVVSAAASKGRVQRLRDRGARAYLTKPIDLAELYEVVHTVLGERN